MRRECGGRDRADLGNGVEAVLPSNASATNPYLTPKISCPSAGNCSAVGTYGRSNGLLLTETGGTWAPGTDAVAPGSVDAFTVAALSCPSAGDCSAVGGYSDPNSQYSRGLLLTETDGTWLPGQAAVPPANASTYRIVELTDVSCASVGNCTAVGNYDVSPSDWEGVLLTETNGTWAPGIEAPLPANARTAAPGQLVNLNSVSCAAAGACTAVGEYFDSADHQEGLLLTETDGTWATGVEVVPPGGDSFSLVNSVSCASAGNCTAIGADTTEGLLLTETAGSWAPAVQADSRYLNSVSCASAGNCAVVGDYYDGSSWQGLLMNQTDGTWSTRMEAMPADVAAVQSGPLYGDPLVGLRSVSCSSPGNCTAAGAYDDGSGNAVPLLVTETDGKWATGLVTSLPANAATPETFSQLDSVSCPATGPCGAAGFYCPAAATCGWDGSKYPNFSGGQEGLLTGDSPPVVELAIAKAGTGSGTVSDVQDGIDCGSSCSASLDAGASPTVVATPAPGSEFVGWSGGNCSPGSPSCMRTLVSDQTVTATFDLLPHCVVPRLRGKTLPAAKRAIRNHSCSVGKITRSTSRRIKRGHVISQKPRPGRRLEYAAKVSLKVSRGP